MNIIVFSRKTGSSRQFSLLKPMPFAALTLIMAGIVVGAFAAGSMYAQRSDLAAVKKDRVATPAQTSARVAELEESLAAGQRHIDALSMRLGQMGAHIIRLDALGKRLTQMAGLDDGEFNFGDAPAQGGPDASNFQGAAVAPGELTEALDDFESQITDRDRQLHVLESVIMTRNLHDKVHPGGRPVGSGFLSSFYGMRSDPFTGRPAMHKGIDFAGRDGTEIIAVAAGVVTSSGERHGFGNLVEINHGNGYVTRYAHNRANLVAVGDTVEKGQTIALMGATGRATGPNLHFEVLSGGRNVDPLKFIQQAN